MARVQIAALRPGAYQTRQGAFDASPARLRGYADRFAAMKAAGIKVPIAWGHQPGAKPDDGTDLATRRYLASKFNAGYLDDAELDPESGELRLMGDVPGAEVEDGKLCTWTMLPDGRKVRSAIGEVSVKVDNWTDGQGRFWPDSLIHLALTPLPVMGGQEGFRALSTEAGENGDGDTATGFYLSSMFLFATERAPVGGITIQGEFYQGGRWIPSAELEKASPAEKKQLAEAKDQHREKLRAGVQLDHEALKGKVAPHAADLSEADQRSAKKTFAALVDYHGDLALHRLHQLIHQDEKRLAGTDEGDTAHGIAKRRLAAYHHMLGWAGEHETLKGVIDQGRKKRIAEKVKADLKVEGRKGSGATKQLADKLLDLTDNRAAPESLREAHELLKGLSPQEVKALESHWKKGAGEGATTVEWMTQDLEREIAKPNWNLPTPSSVEAAKPDADPISSVLAKHGQRLERSPAAASFAGHKIPNQAAVSADTLAAIQSADTDKYIPPNIGAIFDSVQAKHPGLTPEQFHGNLARLHHEGKVQLQPHTRALTTAERPEHLVPIDGEAMGFVRQPRDVTGDVKLASAGEQAEAAELVSAGEKLKDIRKAEKHLGKLHLDGKGDSEEARKLHADVQRINGELKAIRKQRQVGSKPQSQKSEARGFDPNKSYADTSGREPWEMSSKDWQAARDTNRFDDSGNGPSASASRASANMAESQRLTMQLDPETDSGLKRQVNHRDVLEAALAAGKPVPPVVLADYPDLAGKSKSSATGAKTAGETKPKSASAPADLLASLKTLSAASGHHEISHEGITAAVNGSMAGMTAAEAKQLAKDFEIHGPQASKTAAVKAIVDRIRGRKGATERVKAGGVGDPFLNYGMVEPEQVKDEDFDYAPHVVAALPAAKEFVARHGGKGAQLSLDLTPDRSSRHPVTSKNGKQTIFQLGGDMGEKTKGKDDGTDQDELFNDEDVVGKDSEAAEDDDEELSPEEIAAEERGGDDEEMKEALADAARMGLVLPEDLKSPREFMKAFCIAAKTKFHHEEMDKNKETENEPPAKGQGTEESRPILMSLSDCTDPLTRNLFVRLEREHQEKRRKRVQSISKRLPKQLRDRLGQKVLTGFSLSLDAHGEPVDREDQEFWLSLLDDALPSPVELATTKEEEHPASVDDKDEIRKEARQRAKELSVGREKAVATAD